MVLGVMATRVPFRRVALFCFFYKGRRSKNGQWFSAFFVMNRASRGGGRETVGPKFDVRLLVFSVLSLRARLALRLCMDALSSRFASGG